MRNDMTDKANDPSPISPTPPIPNVELKAALLLVLMLALMAAAAVYLMYARGTFESIQKLVLIADDAEGVVIGMDVTFSGFPIGRVRRIELNEEGKARIIVAVAK